MNQKFKTVQCIITLTCGHEETEKHNKMKFSVTLFFISVSRLQLEFYATSEPMCSSHMMTTTTFLKMCTL